MNAWTFSRQPLGAFAPEFKMKRLMCAQLSALLADGTQISTNAFKDESLVVAIGVNVRENGLKSLGGGAGEDDFQQSEL